MLTSVKWKTQPSIIEGSCLNSKQISVCALMKPRSKSTVALSGFHFPWNKKIRNGKWRLAFKV